MPTEALVGRVWSPAPGKCGYGQTLSSGDSFTEGMVAQAWVELCPSFPGEQRQVQGLALGGWTQEHLLRVLCDPT